MTSTPPVIVSPPDEAGGRRVWVEGVNLGTAFSLHDLTVFLQHAGLEGWDELARRGGLGPDRVARRRPGRLDALTRSAPPYAVDRPNPMSR